MRFYPEKGTTMAKNFLEIINLNHSRNKSAFKEDVTRQLWTIHYWKTGKALLEAIVRKATGTFIDTQLWVKHHRGSCAYGEDEFCGMIPAIIH